jgi:Protein of unknown function (DUF2568)
LAENPINLTVRFLMETAMLVSLGAGGWYVSGPTWMRFVLAITGPLVAATLWGVVATRNDVVRGTSAPLMVPGWTRLLKANR